MASAVAGYRTSLGADGPPCCYADIDLADCLVVWGSNMAEAFPVTFDRVKAHLKANPGVELIVVDPRRTNTASTPRSTSPSPPAATSADERRRPAPPRARCRGHDFVAAHTDGFEATASSSCTRTGRGWS